MKVVAVGNPFDGVTLYGPFGDYENEYVFCDQLKEDWWLVGLEPPNPRSAEDVDALFRGIDGPLFRQQREWLAWQNDEHARGLTELLDKIADWAHDCWGVDCLLEEESDDAPG